MRTKNQIHCLSGHQGTVWGIETQGTDPQVITGSSDKTVKVCNFKLNEYDPSVQYLYFM